MSTLVMRRVVGVALGWKDLNDHNQLRQDPVLWVLDGKPAQQALNLAIAVTDGLSTGVLCAELWAR